MTFKEIEKIVIDNKIPKNVLLQSDSGWAGWKTDMDGVYYNKKENIIVFTQCSALEDYEMEDSFYNIQNGWIDLVNK